jgi:hypothetical protein
MQISRVSIADTMPANVPVRVEKNNARYMINSTKLRVHRGRRSGEIQGRQLSDLARHSTQSLMVGLETELPQ